MTISVSISKEAEAKLMAKAAAAGVDVAAYASQALERVVSRPTLDEVLEPLRAEFDQSGMTDDELSGMLEAAKHEARAGY
jgi:pyruvate carboxylase